MKNGKSGSCVACQGSPETFHSFGRMPIANGFLTPAEFETEYFFELAVAFCERCRMVQLVEQPNREMMFHENYAFFSSTSRRMGEHFREFGEWIGKYLAPSDPFVVEIGSNDGILLKHFALSGTRHLGIEPSANVAAAARENGVRTISEFFDENLAKRILDEYGPADAFLGANVMCHLPNLHSVAEGVRLLLKPKGVLAFEDPYLGDILEKTSYDQIYDEHAVYFSLGSVSNLFREHGMEVIDVLPQPVHGGSMRYVVANAGARPVAASVAALRLKEEAAGLGRSETYARFSENVERSRDQLKTLLQDLRRDGRRIVGYAATSKSTTVTNYCGITPDLVEFICDTTPIKQGKFSPGVHIPVRPYESFAEKYPDFSLLFGWNHAEEILAKEEGFRAAGGRWIVYVPSVRVLP